MFFAVSYARYFIVYTIVALHSVPQAEFTVRYQRLLGKNAIFPFGFHCTGMPIQAAANKLRAELEEFGNPPVFPVPVEKREEQMDGDAIIAAKSKGKKSKQAVKGNSGPSRQWDIMKSCGVPLEEIQEFVDPVKWLHYFPPFGATDLKAFGCAIDWRRSFITTSENPYYDAFIRWQFNRLREGNKIKFGKRPAVFSVRDGQVCADHDRASGENVGPQEYTLIKLLAVAPYPVGSKLNSPELAGKKVYLAPATLRPETMYGQTNCFVLPEGDYGCFETKQGDILVISHRAAKGLAYQSILKEDEKYPSICNLKGNDLLGVGLKAPMTSYETIYVLPLLTISMSKGTGVVTSVPSDAPDDYAALKELKDKPLWREKFGLTAEMVEPFEVIPIIKIEGYGDKSAEFMCEKLGIVSHKDAEKLKQAKDEVYLKGFYEGVMLVGNCSGMKVCDAKPLIRQQLIDAGDALPYFEPEGLVMSRSGDECIVALADQWYLSYGDDEWMQTVMKHVKGPNFNSYNEKIAEQFEFVLGWLKEWACSRQFGLGTLLPWDKKWVIESLSDSTIYMAYYTIAHFIHGSVENLGSPTMLSPCGHSADEFTDEVFDYLFLRKPYPSSSSIPESVLKEMKDEFEYWYPMDLRVSAKDLIPNHLTMSLYNHVEIWKDHPDLWPRGMYCNGHIMVDAVKMSKSKGNFLMLLQCVEEYSADATRFALADAGDSLEDANFDRHVANQAVSYLFVEEEWIQSMFLDAKNGNLREGEFTFMDAAFINEVDYLVDATKADFDQMNFRDGLHRCWFDMIIARDLYRDWSIRCGIPMHKLVLQRFVVALTIMMAPITPHWCEHIWMCMGHTDISVCDATWPTPDKPYDKLVRKQYVFFRDTLKNARQACIKSKVSGRKRAFIILASTYDDKKKEVLKYLASVCNADGQFPETLLKDMKGFFESNPELKKETKNLMQFGAFMRDEAKNRGPDALGLEQPFDQRSILVENREYIMKSLDVADVQFFYNDEQGIPPGAASKRMEQIIPGKPEYTFLTVE